MNQHPNYTTTNVTVTTDVAVIDAEDNVKATLYHIFYRVPAAGTVTWKSGSTVLSRTVHGAGDIRDSQVNPNPGHVGLLATSVGQTLFVNYTAGAGGTAFQAEIGYTKQRGIDFKTR